MKWNHRCHRCMPPHFEHERHSFGSITFPLAHCANTIAMFATLWETFQNDKGNHLSSQKERWFLDSWCESAMEMKRSRLINEEAETIRQIYINAEFCLSIGLHRDKLPNKFYLVADLCHVFDQFKRSPVCHSFLKTILQHPVRPMLSPMLRPLLPWSGIPWAPLGQSRQSKSNQRCQWKVNGKEWKHYGIQGLLVSLLALLAFDDRVTMPFLNLCSSLSHSTRSPSFWPFVLWNTTSSVNNICAQLIIIVQITLHFNKNLEPDGMLCWTSVWNMLHEQGQSMYACASVFAKANCSMLQLWDQFPY